jgi:hypothetical protein
MIKLYSYKEQQEVIMLEKHEWEKVEPYWRESIKQIQDYREKTGANLDTAIANVETKINKAYYEITGTKVTGRVSIYNRQRSLFGPICTSCSKPYRTPKASFCAECGNKNSTEK